MLLLPWLMEKESQNCPSSLLAAADLSTSTCTRAGHQPMNPPGLIAAEMF